LLFGPVHEAKHAIDIERAIGDAQTRDGGRDANKAVLEHGGLPE
jgi:hypothetical protein